MTNDEIDRIVFPERELTIGELKLVRRLMNWATVQDWDAFTALLLARATNLTAAQVDSINLSQVALVIKRLEPTILKGTVITAAARTMYDQIDTVVDKLMQGRKPS